MDQVVEVQVKSVYGTERIYPINDKAHKLANLLGRKTFNKADIDKLKSIGFTIKWIPIKL